MRPNPITRRRFLWASAAGLAAVGLNACWFEPNRVSVSRHVLGNPVPGRKPLRIVQLSDLHLGEVGSHEERIAEAVHALSPHLIVLTGDSIDRRDRLDTLGAFLSLLPKPARKFAILGNWEHWARVDLSSLDRLYESRGVQLLMNRSASVEHGGAKVLLTGLDDATAGVPRIQEAVDVGAPCLNHLILAHSPVYRDRLSADLRLPASPGPTPPQGGATVGIDPEYMLSGHTHGGQVKLLGWSPLRPRGSGRYVSGWYRDRKPHLYVSRGLGTSILPVRFGVPPEVASFMWHLRE